MKIDLTTKLGSPKSEGVITDVLIEKITMPDKTEQDKVCLIVDKDGKTIRINEIYVENFNGSKTQKGLWVRLDEKKAIDYLSPLGKFLRHYEVETLSDLIGCKIKLFVGKKDFLVGGF
ncbi:MAG: hypothetical protein ACW990_20635 [Promethearchaeota archaeon]|jgi:hypothetical protein